MLSVIDWDRSAVNVYIETAVLLLVIYYSIMNKKPPSYFILIYEEQLFIHESSFSLSGMTA